MFAATLLVGWTAEAQVVGADDRLVIRCGTSHDLPEGPPRVMDYQMVAAPAGSTTEIGVLFLYTDHFKASQVRTRTRDWVKTANGLFDAGKSGIRLKSVGVRAAPSSISRKAASASDFEDWRDFRPVLAEVTRLDAALRDVRSELGADLVTVVAPAGPGAWGIAHVWHNQLDDSDMRKRSYNVVSMRADQVERLLFYEGFIFTHEIGHNLGLHHDRKTLDDGNGASSADWEKRLWDRAGFGYLNHASGFVYRDGTPAPAGTIMAYADNVWLRGFSRPGDLPVYRYEDIELRAGDSTANADRALRQTAAAVAAFYDVESSEPLPDDDEEPPPPDEEPPPLTRKCLDSAGELVDCHTTASGHVFAVQYFHQGEWKFAEIEVTSGDSAVFHFFGPDNLEVFAKVLDGCAIDGTVWVYASGLTDLPIRLTVLRSGSDESKGFSIPDGTVLRPNNGGRLSWC